MYVHMYVYMYVYNYVCGCMHEGGVFRNCISFIQNKNSLTGFHIQYIYSWNLNYLFD